MSCSVCPYGSVFLHPQTGEEYALARTERKTGPGYRGFETLFAPDVTLEQDLERRDLTINAIAQDPDNKSAQTYMRIAQKKSGPPPKPTPDA